jgi:hypothetical protein
MGLQGALSGYLKAVLHGTVACSDSEHFTADDHSSATIRVVGVRMCARRRWITSRGNRIPAAGELDATPASRIPLPLLTALR